MGIIGMLLVLIVFALITYFVNAVFQLPQTIRVLVNVLLLLVFLYWALGVFNVLPFHHVVIR